MRVFILIAPAALLTLAATPLAAAEAAADSAHKPGVFDGYIGESIWTLVWFLVLLAVLWKFAWKPILSSLNLRQEHIERQISDAEKMREEAKKVLAEYHAKLSDADRQGREIISARVREAEKQAIEVEHAKQQEIEAMKTRAEVELERERLDAEEYLWQQAGQIILQLGSDVFGKTLDAQDNQKLIDEAIGRLRSPSGDPDNVSHS
jgi:F-type H+-transporting ATPase subunit b